MKDWILKVYARKHLGRAVAATGVLAVAFSYLFMLVPGAVPATVLLYPLGLVCLPAGAIVGIINLVQKAKGSQPAGARASETEDPANTILKKRYAGRFTALAGLLVMFSPIMMAAAATQPGHTMWSEGDPGSGGTYIWYMLVTLPLGFAIIVTGAIIGLVTMNRNARNQK